MRKKHGGGYLFVLALAIASFFAMSSMALALVDKVICVPWQGDTAKQHTAISGIAVQLKGVIKTTNTAAIYYKWVFGDSSESAVNTLSGSTKYNVATTHVYTAANGTPFTAKLQVSDTTPFSSVKDDSYYLKIEANEINAQVNISIDKGLWWLYNQGGSHGYSSYPHTYDDSPQMTWLQSGWVYTLATPTAAAIQAFGINGHKIKGNPDEDPYVEAVQYGMNYLTKGYNYYTSNPALQAVNIAGNLHGVGDNPDANGNSYGVQVYDWYANHVPYQLGQIMDAIIASGVAPTDLTGRDYSKESSDISAKNWTYGELLQDMADMYAWGQSDSTGCNGGICGSWWYGWNYGFPGDNSASQWGAIGMLPAQHSPWNVAVPQWVKDYNANWLAYSMGCGGPSSAVTSCGYKYFSYNGVSGCAGDSCLATTTSGMTQMIFDGQKTTDLKWINGQKYVADLWRSFLYDGSTWGGYRTYGWYSLAKALRLSLPAATTQLQKTSGAVFDWYYGDTTNTVCSTEANCELGLAPRVLALQATDGSWSGQMSDPPLTTAWMIITLKPTIFASSPIACFSAAPNPSYANQDITFNPSCSGHSETGKGIANLTKFEWDWNNDGTYDKNTSTPAAAVYQFSCADLPCTYPVKLRVTDDSTPPLEATQIVNISISNPPHPPVAKPGGPYMTSLCTNDTLILDGSKSFDQDEGQKEAGCLGCPVDTITAWGWDLTAPLTGFNDKSGKFVTIPGTGAGNIASYFGAGTYDIGLKVTDNSSLAYPNGSAPLVQGDLTNSAFGSVTVQSACICNLAARAKLNKIQLTWTNVLGAKYDIYRSTEGPNTGFAKIATDVVTTYSTYLDETGLVLNKKYYYRVVPTGGNCTGGSNVASATPANR